MLKMNKTKKKIQNNMKIILFVWIYLLLSNYYETWTDYVNTKMNRFYSYNIFSLMAYYFAM